jgi:hypothetical protein
LLSKQVLWNWSALVVPSRPVASSRAPPSCCVCFHLTEQELSRAFLTLSQTQAGESDLQNHRTFTAHTLECDSSPQNRTVRLLWPRSPQLLISQLPGSVHPSCECSWWLGSPIAFKEKKKFLGQNELDFKDMLRVSIVSSDENCFACCKQFLTSLALTSSCNFVSQLHCKAPNSLHLMLLPVAVTKQY